MQQPEQPRRRKVPIKVKQVWQHKKVHVEAIEESKRVLVEVYVPHIAAATLVHQ